MLNYNLKKFNEDGFVVIRNLIPKTKVLSIRKEINRISKILIKKYNHRMYITKIKN